MKSSTSDASQTTNDISRHIDQWKLWITGIGALLICAYVVWFGVIVQLPPTNAPDQFGTFGNFFGGLLNPIVAFAAFYWLTQSVKLQQQALLETREGLKKSDDAQALLVKTGHVSMQLAAHTAIVNAINAEIAQLQEDRAPALAARVQGGQDPTSMAKQQAMDPINGMGQQISTTNRKIADLQKERSIHVEAMRELLNSYTAQATQN